MTTLRRYLLEPINALTHFIGAVASFVGLVLLMFLTRDDPPKMISLFVYGVSMVLLYASSTLLHAIKTTKTIHMRLNRLDHMAIFLLIAGTYTPIAYNIFPVPWRWRVLGIVWIVVLLGAAYKLLSTKIHGFLNTSIYVILGWGSAVPLIFATNIIPMVSLQGLLLLLLGGLIFTIGFVIYCSQRPDPWPDVFGHHEIWHLFVLAGSFCHFLFMLYYVVPFERVASP